MIDASKAQRVAERCIKEARTYWSLDPLWQIDLDLQALNEGTPAGIEHSYDYLRATITLDPSQCEGEADVWQYTAHEVAHLVISPFDVAMPTDDGESVRRWFHAIERTTTHLERVFLRERPYKASK